MRELILTLALITIALIWGIDRLYSPHTVQIQQIKNLGRETRPVMNMPNQIACNLEKTPAGWYLTFPSHPQAGLILEKTEAEEFLRDCQASHINLTNSMFFYATNNCPTYWLNKACTFKPCPF